MRALTVKQPWAWALIHGEKRVENRTWSTNYRGPLVIHAGGSVDRDAVLPDGSVPPEPVVRGAAIGVTHLTDVHPEVDGCCAPWGQRGVYHWLVNDPQPLAWTIPARGNLGLWDLPDDLIREVPRGYLSGPPGSRVPQYDQPPPSAWPEE